MVQPQTFPHHRLMADRNREELHTNLFVLHAKYLGPISQFLFTNRMLKGKMRRRSERNHYNFFSYYSFFLLCVSLLFAGLSFVVDADEDVCINSNEGECDNREDTAQKDTPTVCTLYMAQSTIPGAGLGIFTGVDRKKGEIAGAGDVILPISDLEFHFSANENYDPYFYYDPTKNYVWSGEQMGVQFESAAENTGMSAFVPGVDCVVNCHLGLLNVDLGSPSFDNTGLHRSRDPGAGAFTPYYNSTTIVKHEIPIGGELFKDYGDQWFITREGLLGLVPLRDDYGLAEEHIHNFKNLVRTAELSSNLESEIWEMIMGFKSSSRVMAAMPSSLDEVEEVEQNGIRSIYQANATRSIEELEKTGRCLDKIRPGKQSTLPQAGRGAFATRFIRKDEIVIGTPLIFTPTDDFYRMYEGDWMMQSEKPDVNKLKRMQLIINYSWTHPESSLFLIPYGPLVQLINHNQTQANVRVQWAKNGEMSQNHAWLMKSPEEIFPRTTPGLFWDFVATRDIQPGEEIFLDYGDAWEQHWNSYVETWEPPAGAETYISARQWNQENAHAVLRTEKEQAVEPYPNNFEMRCLSDIMYEVELTQETTKNMWDEKVDSMLCILHEKRQEANGDYMYKVHYLPNDPALVAHEGDEQQPEDGELSWYVSDWIPRGAISFVDAAYTSDIFLEKAFRHPIQIPDDIFPKPWQGFQGVLY